MSTTTLPITAALPPAAPLTVDHPTHTFPTPAEIHGITYRTSADILGIVPADQHSRYVAYLRDTIGLTADEIGTAPDDVFGDAGEDFREWIENHDEPCPFAALHAELAAQANPANLTDTERAELAAKALESSRLFEENAVNVINRSTDEYRRLGTLFLEALNAHRRITPEFGLDDVLAFARDRNQNIRYKTTGDPTRADCTAWMKSIMFRDALAEHGIPTTSIPYTTLAECQSSAILIDYANLSATLRDGWLDFMAPLASRYTAGTGPSTNKFRRMLAASGLKRDRKGALLPIVPMTDTDDEAADGEKKPKGERKRVDVSAVLARALKAGDATIDTMLNTIAALAKSEGIPLPPAMGLDIAKATAADAERIVETFTKTDNLDTLSAIVRLATPRLNVIAKMKAEAIAASARLQSVTPEPIKIGNENPPIDDAVPPQTMRSRPTKSNGPRIN